MYTHKRRNKRRKVIVMGDEMKMEGLGLGGGVEEVKQLSSAVLLILASLTYAYVMGSKVRPGKWRFMSLFPVFYLFTLRLPYSLSSAFSTALVTFFITWLSNFKLLLFCFHRGPLTSIKFHHTRRRTKVKLTSFLLFIIIASLPINIKMKIDDDTMEKNKRKKKKSLNLAAELVGFAILVYFSSSYKQRLHKNMKMLLLLTTLYSCSCFLLIDILIALSSKLVLLLLKGMGMGMSGVEMEAPSDEPYLSTSLQDFWGKRWNLTVSSTLRDTVYRPLRRWGRIQLGEWAPLPAVLGSFLVSGVMHELLFYNVTRAPPTWEMTSFFVLQGVCVVLEMGVKTWWGRVMSFPPLPLFLSRAFTLAFLLLTALCLFFPPLIRNGADAAVLHELRILAHLLTNSLSF